MPEFDNISPYVAPTPGNAPYNPTIPTTLPGFENPSSETNEKENNFAPVTLNDIADQLATTRDKTQVPATISYKELADNSRYATYNPAVTDMEDYKAQGQSGLARLGNSLVNLVGKTVAYAGQTAGFILGVPAAIATGDISNMTDNFIVKAADSLKDSVQDNFPIYKTDKYTYGSIWDKLGTSSWWLDDGMDRLALTLSMFVPGLAEAKGIGLAGATFDEAGNLVKATGLATKGIEAIANSPEDYSWIAKTFLPKLYKAASSGIVDEGVNPALRTYAQSLQRGELYAWNIIGQSALNARETQEAIRTKLTQDRDNGLNQLSDDEIKNKAAEGASSSFWETVPLSLAGSLVELPQMFSTARTAKSLLNKLFDSDTAEALESTAETSTLKSLGKLGVRAALTGLEHGQNESLQVAVSRYNEDRLEGKDTRGTINGIFGDYLDNINDPNGQNNIALGTIQGILTSVLGAQGIGRYTKAGKQRVASEKAQSQHIVDVVNEARMRYRQYQQDYAQRDENNKIITNPDGSVKWDQDKLAQQGLSIADIQDVVQRKTQAIANGDYTMAEMLDKQTLASIARPYFDDPNGMEHLIGMMTVESKKLDPDRVSEDAYGNSLTPSEQLVKNIETVKQLKSAYDSIDQRHAGFFNLGVDPKDKTLDKGDKTKMQRAGEFIHYLKNAQYSVAADQVAARNTISQLNSKIQSVAAQNDITIPEEGKEIENPTSPAEEQINDLLYDKYRWTDFLEDRKNKYKLLVNKSLWKDAFDKHQEDINGYVDNVLEGKQMTSRRAENIAPNTSVQEGDYVTTKDNPIPQKIQSITEDGKFATLEGNGTAIPMDELTKHPTFDIGRTYTTTSDLYKNQEQQGNHSTLDIAGNAINTTENRDESRAHTKAFNDKSKSITVLSQNDDGSYNVKFSDGTEGTVPLQATSLYAPEATEEEKQAELAKRNADIKDTEDKTGISTQPYTAPTFEEAKKSKTILFASTVAPNEQFTNEAPKPHQLRANYFGAILPKLSNKDEYKAILIHKGNEDKYGLTGLTALSKGTYTPKEGWNNDNEVIAAVIVHQDGTDLFLSDENGKPTTKLGDKADLDSVVFQVMPTPSITNSQNQNRYRATDDINEIHAYQEGYKQWRANTLNSQDISPYEVEASFGFVKPGMETDKRYHISTSLVKDISHPIVKVSTTADQNFSNAYQSLNAPLGTTFIVTDNLIQQVRNRKLTENEIENVYQAMRVIAKYADQRKLKEKEPQAIMSSLKGLLYWGTPDSDAGRNSMWFDLNKGLYNFGKEGNNVPFTEKGVIDNEAKIREYLADMYNNVNASNLSDKYFNAPYYEIQSFKDDVPNLIRWNTYQDYLLSSKYPDGTNRAVDDTPITTTVPPILPSGVSDLNAQTRQGIYFSLQGLSDELYKPITPSTPAQAANEVGFVAALREKIAEEKKTKVEIKEQKPVANSIEAKKADIERRRQDEFIDRANSILPKNMKATIKNGFDAQTGKKGLSELESIHSHLKLLAPFNDKFQNRDEELSHEINTKYDAELVALETPKSEEPDFVAQLRKSLNTTPPADTNVNEWLNKKKINPTGRKNIDRRIASQVSVTPENWARIQLWAKDNLPNIPIYRVKNMLHVMNDVYSWGAYSDGAIYVFNNAEQGTYFHEAFHAVSRNFLSPDEVGELRNEFRQRNGSYTDYQTDNPIKYSDATDGEIDEQLAEEFREYVLSKGNQSLVGKIGQFFKELWNFIKSIVGKDDKIQTLFNKINAGKYRNYTTGRNTQGINDIDYADDLENANYRLTSGESYAITQHMLSLTLDYLFGKTTDEEGNRGVAKGLYNIRSIPKGEFYSTLKNLTYRSLIDDYLNDAQSKLAAGQMTQEQFTQLAGEKMNLQNKLDEHWDEIQKAHETEMKIFDIKFDENDELFAKNENYNGREYGQNAMKVDPIKKATLAIKLLLSGVKKVVPGAFSGNILEAPEIATSIVGGDLLVSQGKAFVNLLDNLADSPTFDTQIQRLVELSKNNPEYIRLFTDLRGNRINGSIQWDKLTPDDLRLLIGFHRTFSKQAPEVIEQYVMDDGTTMMRSTITGKQASQIEEQWVSNMTANARNATGYLQYGENINPTTKKKEKGYYATAVSGARINTPEARIKFLNNLGIDASMEDYRKLSPEDRPIFNDQVKGIYDAFSKGVRVLTLNKQTLNISNNIGKLANIIAKVRNPDADSTFTNIEGQMQQGYIEKNYFSHFAEVLNNVKNIKELTDTNFSYLLTDPYNTNSLLKEKLFDKYGNRTKFQLSIGYIQGTTNRETGRNTATDKLTYGQRILQEFNANLSGYYHLVEPADSDTQWMWKIGNNFHYNDLLHSGLDWNNTYNVFSKYLKDEIALVRDKRPNVISPNKLRMFDTILKGTGYDKVYEDIRSNKSADDIYSGNKEYIDGKIKEFIQKEIDETKADLLRYGIIEPEPKKNTYTFNNLNINDLPIKSKTFTESTLNTLLMYRAINYALNQMDAFKMVLGDPHQAKDWLKRVKSFLSPRATTIHSSPEINRRIDEKYNRVGTVKLQPGEIGYMEVKDYAAIITLKDVMVRTKLYPDEFVEPDAQGYVSDDYNREFRIKNHDWDDNDEAQYQYDKAWERNHKNQYTDDELRVYDKEILAKGNPGVITAYKQLKPIFTGQKLDKDYAAISLYKLSVAPISYRMIYEPFPNSNLLRMVEKMHKENIGYAVFESGNKIGNEFSNAVYDANGKFNEAEFQGIVNLGYENMGIQVETSPKPESYQTLGSQLTKLATMDMMAGGVPIDYKGLNWEDEPDKEKASPLYKKIMYNQRVLEEMQNDGYQRMLKDIGVKDNGTSFEIVDRNKLASTLEDQTNRREANDNVRKALIYFRDNEMSLESTNVYQQFKNIIYSIVDKNVTSPKVRGKGLYQLASTMFEDERLKVGEDSKGNPIYSSTNLKEWEDEDGKRHIEVYISSQWIRSQLPKKYSNTSNRAYISDDELYKMCTPDVLEGIGFRIPTQNANSSDVFVIKKFLPMEMGDAVVVPSSMVKKTGSDFDIDKLNTYLKNIYLANDGTIQSVPFFGFGEEAQNKFKDWNAIQVKEDEEDLTDEELQMLDRQNANFYTQSLQNEYYNSLKDLLSDPINFNKITTPNSVELFKEKIAPEIRKLKGIENPESTDPSLLLSSRFVSRNRHNNITGNDGVGVAVTSQTGHTLRQRSLFYLDTTKLKDMPQDLREWLGNGNLKFGKGLFNHRIINGKPVITLSDIKTANGEYSISDLISQFTDGAVDIAKGAWLMDMLGDIRKLPTALLMTEMGFDPYITAYFLNQPIIEDYLEKIDSKGYKWLFINDFVDELKDSPKYATDNISNQIQSKNLKGYIGKTEFDENGKADQQAILDEFLKLTRMSNHLLLNTLAISWDTTDFTDPYTIDKKNWQLEEARQTIFNSVDKILDNSFVGNTRNIMNQSREAIANYIPTELSSRAREAITSTLRRFSDQRGRAFNDTARKVVNSFIDYTIQVHDQMVKDSPELSIKHLSLDNGGIATELKSLIDSLPKDHALLANPFISKLRPLLSERINNIAIAGKNNSTYDQNAITDGLRELRENPLTQNIYPQIVRMSILQGIGNSSISFTQLLPVEDMKDFLSPIFDSLDKTPYIENFSEIHAFERNNWNNPDLVPNMFAYKTSKAEGLTDTLREYARVAQNHPQAADRYGKSLIMIDAQSRVGDQDVFTFVYNNRFDDQGNEYTPERIREMRKAGDYSYQTKLLVQKVYEGDEPLRTNYSIKGTQRSWLYFKAVNAWGIGNRLQEYYPLPQASEIENGYTKVPEFTDEDIVNTIRNRNQPPEQQFPDKKLEC